MFKFESLLKKADNDSDIYQESLLLSQVKAIKPSYTSKKTLDVELEALRQEVLNCGASSMCGDEQLSNQYRHSIKVQSIGS